MWCTTKVAEPANKQRLWFSGYEWTVKAGAQQRRLGPGPNRWEAANVNLDTAGRLRLRIRKEADSGWSCAEVGLTQQRLGFGLYEFQTIGPIGQLDPNVVLGLFNYPPPEVGPDTTNEIDIEYARWGNARAPIGNFTLWPARKAEKSVSHTFAVPADIEQATHRFLWLPDRIVWQALRGHAKDVRNNRGEFAGWEFKPPAGSGLIPQQPLPVLMNLWLFQGKAPTDGKETNITLARFVHHPRPSRP